jgi:branched-chain amino acid transport system substrate-binding protein
VLGTVIRETVGVMSEARKIGLNAEFVGVSAAYSAVIPKLGGAAVEGFSAFYAVGEPYPDDPSPGVRDWVKRYRDRNGDDPEAFAVMGYLIIAWTEIGLREAGRDLTATGFAQAIERAKFPRDLLGLGPLNVELSFSPTRHLGNRAVRQGRITNGRWVAVTDFYTP